LLGEVAQVSLLQHGAVVKNAFGSDPCTYDLYPVQHLPRDGQRSAAVAQTTATCLCLCLLLFQGIVPAYKGLILLKIKGMSCTLLCCRTFYHIVMLMTHQQIVAVLTINCICTI